MIEHRLAEFMVEDAGPEAVHVSGFLTHVFENGDTIGQYNRFRLLREEYERAETISIRCTICGEFMEVPKFPTLDPIRTGGFSVSPPPRPECSG